jgi:hypothetical protein
VNTEPTKTKVRILSSVMFLMFCQLIAATASAQVSNDAPFVLGPPSSSEPIPVHVGFFLSDVTDLDEEREMFEFEAVLTVSWLDERQAFDPGEIGVKELVYQGGFQFNEVFTGWWPQLVLANESGAFDRQGEMLSIKPDGSMTYVQVLDAVVKSKMNLHKIPFDSQSLEIIFKCLGLDSSEVVLIPDLENTGYRKQGVGLAQWVFQGLTLSPLDHKLEFSDGHTGIRSHVAVHVNMTRNPNYMLRLVVFPLFILIALSWSIFWMQRESLGERMDISFLGILTIVAYQIMITENLPRIDYMTLMSVFLYLSLLSMAAGVVVNLYVSHLDRLGRVTQGDNFDRRCRWVFPATYLGLNAVSGIYFFLVK